MMPLIVHASAAPSLASVRKCHDLGGNYDSRFLARADEVIE